MSPILKLFIEFRKAGYLWNCTILSKSLLGNGELASLAYGSLKELLQIEELYNIEEPRQGGLVARLWPVMARYRFVIGLSSVRSRFVIGSFTLRHRFVHASSSVRSRFVIGPSSTQGEVAL
jgi:hypothetical protein